MVDVIDAFGPETLAGSLPPRPGPDLWPYLDAAARCIERFGFSRTRVTDVAREMGVDRTTVYRRVGSMDHILGLLIARELHFLMDGIPRRVAPGSSAAELVVDLLAGAVEHALAHPVLAKVLRDEPEVAGRLLPAGTAALLERVVTTLAPPMRAAMDAGLIARRDPVIVTEWIARTGLSLLVAPPPVELRPFLREVLEPVLAPAAPTAPHGDGR